MKKKLKYNAHAKINLFLKIIDKRKDGFHNIISNVIFINLFDEIEVSLNEKNSITYKGKFKAKSNLFENDIIKKTLDFCQIKQPLEIKIKKNIPTQAGLGSASTNAAALIKALENLKLIKKHNFDYYVKLGSDIPVCLLSQNCLVSGRGEKISRIKKYKKYFFLLIKPDINISTKEMYNKISKIKLKKLSKKFNKKYLKDNIFNIGNDFEKIASKKNKKIKQLLEYLRDLKESKYSGMSGSGSCCYSIFENEKNLQKAYKNIIKKFPRYWFFIGHNIK